MSSTWLVTGATSGFGRLVTERVLAGGAHVIAVGRRRERLAELAEYAPQGRLTAIGMYPAARLARRFSTIAPVSVLRLGRLGYEWQQNVKDNADVRLWKGNTLVPAAYHTVDDVILERAPLEWTPASELIGGILGGIEGLLASDWFLFWRCRDLIGAGMMVMRCNADSLQN